MAAAFHILCFAIKVILLIIFFPFILVWFIIKHHRYRVVLRKNLIQAGMPEDFARKITRELRLSNMFSFV